jgi:hypothetical protein
MERKMSGIPRKAQNPNSKEEEKQVKPQRKLGIQTQKKKRSEWNPKGSLGSKLKRRREASGNPREDRDPNSKEEENRVESQGRLRIQTQKKKRIKWNPKGGSGSKLKRRRELSGIPREARDPNSKEEEK